MEPTKKTALGLDPNLEALLCYLVGWITGLIFLLLEKDNKFVRFHAMQSFITFLALGVLSVVFVIIPVLGLLVSLLIWPK